MHLGIRRVAVENAVDVTVIVETKQEDGPQQGDEMHLISVARPKTRREVHNEAKPKLQKPGQRVSYVLGPIHTGEERSVQLGILPRDDSEHEGDD